MLNSYGIVTENTKNAIKRTIQKGIDVIIASGRPIDSIKTIANRIKYVQFPNIFTIVTRWSSI